MIKNRLRLIPMYDLKAVLNTWHFYKEGVEEILEHSAGDTSFAKIFVEIMNKEVLFWVAFVEGVYAGFFTTRIDQTAPLTNKYFTIVHLYIKQGVPPEMFDEGLLELEMIAKEKFSCDAIRFYTTRKGWERKLKGWETGYIEYVKRLEEKKE